MAADDDVSTRAVANALVRPADSKVDQALTDHRLTAAQAVTIKTALPGRITVVVNRTF